MEFVKKIPGGEMSPRGYGLAWHDYRRDLAVTMPVPFNVLAGMIRRTWFWLLGGWWGGAAGKDPEYISYRQAKITQRKIQDAYSLGFYEGTMAEARLAPAGGDGEWPQKALEGSVEDVGISLGR